MKIFQKGALPSILEQFFFSLALRAANGGSAKQILGLRRVIETSRLTARCFDDSTQHDDLFC